MRILLLSHKPPYPAVDGGTIASLRLASDLAEQGNEVSVLSMVTYKHPSTVAEIPEELKQRINFTFVEVNTEISVIDILKNFFFSSLPYTAERFFNKEFESVLLTKLREKTFDVIQLEGLYLTPYISLIRKQTQIPISLRAHNIEYKIWQRMAADCKNPVKKYYLTNLSKRVSRFEHAVINQYDILVPLTKTDEAIFQRMGNREKSVVVPVGVKTDIADETSSPQTEKQSLFYLGSLDWRPNTDGLLWFVRKVWPSIKEDFPDLEFHVAGRGASSDFPKKIGAEGVVFHGKVPDAKSFIKEHGIMVVPLFSGSGMRVKIIEAMSFGKAIVTTRVGAEGIDVINGEHILISDTAEGTVAYVKQFLVNSGFQEKIERNAQKLAYENYSGNKLAQQLTCEYAKLAK